MRFLGWLVILIIIVLGIIALASNVQSQVREAIHATEARFDQIDR